MIAPQRLPLFATLFAAVYAVVYVVAVENNYALFTYHPVLNQFAFLVEAPKTGPAMYWYGWMATAGIAAFVVGVIASVVPEGVMKFLWSSWSWVVPLTVMLVVSYLLRDFFIPRAHIGQTPAVEQPRSEAE